MKNHPLAKVKKLTLRTGTKIWTPRPGGTIETSSGRKYVVADNGSTIVRDLSETEDTERTIRAELKRLACSKLRLRAFKKGEDILIDVAQFDDLEAADLWSALRELPSNAGYKRVLAVCQRLKKEQR